MKEDRLTATPEQFRRARLNADLSQQDAATILGMSPVSVSNIERGKTTNISPAYVITLMGMEGTSKQEQTRIMDDLAEVFPPRGEKQDEV